MPVEKLEEWTLQKTDTIGLHINVWVPTDHHLANALKAQLTGKSSISRDQKFIELVIPVKKICPVIGFSDHAWQANFKNGLVFLLLFELRKQNPNFHIQTFEEISLFMK